MPPVTLTLDDVYKHPKSVTYTVEISATDWVVLRPLQADDVDKLVAFLEVLSPQTRRFSTFPSYDRATAQLLCEAINRYDKLRFVVEIPTSTQIVGLFEFSFDIPERDLQRYAQHGVQLDARHDCRFGPTLADSYQGKGLGSKLFPSVVDVARKFGKRRMILWGRVLADNGRAIRFYEKQGFQPIGMFEGDAGQVVFDMMLEIGESGS